MEDHYALGNPVSLLLNKPKADFTREDMINVIREKRIERINFHYTALDGKLKELKIPIADRYQAERILAEGERVDGSSLFKGMVDSTVSDLYVVPLYQSAFLNPFDEGSLDFMCRYLTREGQLAPFALDSILHNAGQLFRKNTGLEFYALGELEFFLLTAPQSQIFPAQKQRGYHATAPFIKSGEILDEMVYHITRITGSVKYAHSEVGYIDKVRSDLEEIKGKRAEQVEIEFLPTPIEETGDSLVLARWLIRNIAYKHGCVVTFSPKLEEGIAGNGLHVHMEIRRRQHNIMTEENGELSEAARRIIGGLCNYADSLTAFGNTTSSAYLRLVPNQEAPTHICWSDLNRSAMIRVPLAWSRLNNLAQRLNPQQKEPFRESRNLQTVELRSPDGSAIIHLLLAGITMAAEWGMQSENALEIARQFYIHGPVPHHRGGGVSLPVLPGSCVESAKILLKKRDLYERNGVFPPGVIEYVAKLLQAENDATMNRDLADLPADDRLLQTRRIMHKDLHRH